MRFSEVVLLFLFVLPPKDSSLLPSGDTDSILANHRIRSKFSATGSVGTFLADEGG